jgi:hypothetical protein
LFIAGFTALLTWLTLAAAGVPDGVNRWWTGGVALTVFGLLAGYMVACMRRHCHHDDTGSGHPMQRQPAGH